MHGKANSYTPKKALCFREGPPKAKDSDRGWASAFKVFRKMAPSLNSDEFSLLALSFTYESHFYAAIALLNNTPAPSRTEGQQPAIQQLREIASIQQEHEAQLQALCLQMQKEDAYRRTGVVPEFLAKIHQKMSAATESLFVPFATMLFLASVVPLPRKNWVRRSNFGYHGNLPLGYRKKVPDALSWIAPPPAVTPGTLFTAFLLCNETALVFA